MKKIALSCGPDGFILNGRYVATEKSKTYRIVVGPNGPSIIVARKERDSDPMCIIEPENSARK